MRITKLGHSCLLVEEGEARLLIDPGAFSGGYDELTGLDAVLVTHQHPDHVAPARLAALLAANPEAALITDPGTATMLEEQAGLTAEVLRAGETTSPGGLEVLGVGEFHEKFHADAELITNTGFLVGRRLYHPGDALTVPEAEVEVLAVPLVAPWSNIGQTIDFVRAVHARTTFPIHDAIIVAGARGIFDGAVTGLGVQGRAYQRIDDEPLEL